MMDWRLVDGEELRILLKRNISYLNLLEKNFPEFMWERNWSFFSNINGIDRKRIFLDGFLIDYFWVRNQLDLSEIKEKIFSSFPGGATVLTYHNGSPQRIFNEIYPELNPRFRRVSSGYWKDLGKNFLMERLLRLYRLKRKEDWYRLSTLQVRTVFGSEIPKRQLIRILEFLYPEENWDLLRFSERLNKRARQKFLGVMLAEVFRGEVVVEEFHCRSRNKTYIFDFYVPSRKLVIEYQGEQHYFNVLKWTELGKQRERDSEKEMVCLNDGLKLVHVPYWWDNSIDSLKKFVLGEPSCTHNIS
eukprot:TRINITY_DN3087_c0_g1_i2.p1 TRINITY_DN3087_c0_g1~~TRINITY_DN3087_c0_g1_i2.p1  ORF type:complete len:302 (+),score=22.84 TRINITY_DN3087_c0_g1_i2:350-1255(+)